MAICLVLFLAAFASHLNAQPVIDAQQYQNGIDFQQYQSVIDEVKELIEKLAKVVQSAADSAINEINKAFSTFQDFANGLMNGAMPLIQEGVAKLLDQLNDLKNKALNAGVDIADCLVDHEDKITNLPAEISEGVHNCVDDAIKQAGEAVHEAIKSINDLVAIVDQRSKELQKCNLSIICAARVLAEVTGDIAQIPLRIAGHAATLVKDIAVLDVSTKACIVDQVAQIPVKGGIILTEIAQCVNDKINNETVH